MDNCQTLAYGLSVGPGTQAWAGLGVTGAVPWAGLGWAGETPLWELWASQTCPFLDLVPSFLVCVCFSTVVPDTEKEQEWTPTTGPLLAFKEEDQLLVRRLSRHILHGEGASAGLWGRS